MRPLTTARGKLVMVCAALLIFHGSVIGGPIVAAFGVTIAAAVSASYFYFYVVATSVRKGQVEIGWSLRQAGTISVGRRFFVAIKVQNDSVHNFLIAKIAPTVQTGLEINGEGRSFLPKSSEVSLAFEGVPLRSGKLAIHGAAVWFGDSLGFFKQPAYFPCSVSLNVLPAQVVAPQGSQLLPGRGGDSVQSGPNPRTLKGLEGEFKELRHYQAGDPFKAIAWKATAKRRKLVVRDFQDEVVRSHFIAVDMGANMREPNSALASAIEFASGYAKSALSSGDRVGLATFDTRVHRSTQVKPGAHHLLNIASALAESYNVVDSDLTDSTASELVSTVAKYLAHQHSIDIRIKASPALDSPVWEHLQAGPRGELYDLRAGDRILSKLLKPEKNTEPKIVIDRDADSRISSFRRFCQVQGIDLPYRRIPTPGLRRAGFNDSINLASQSKAQVLVVLSDFSGITDSPIERFVELTALRRRGRRVLFLYPLDSHRATTGHFPEAADHKTTAALLASREKYESARHIFERLGVQFAPLFPNDTVHQALSRLRPRHSARRAS